MALQGNALKEYNAQFQRSIASPEALSDKKKPVVLDGAAVLDKYIGGESAAAMTGAEFYALVGHIKRQHGQRGEALEQELMKVTRQMDKKIRLLDWCTTNLGRKEEPIAQPTAAIQAAAAAMANENLPPAGTPSRPMATKPALEMSVNKLDLSGLGGERDVGASTARPSTARPQLGGDAMAGLLGAAPTTGAATARPATATPPGKPAAAAAQPPADMSVVMAAFMSGRDHLKMSGAEYHSLLTWLKSKGHENIEDTLLKVRSLGDKKFHLVKYMREKCATLLPPNATMAIPPMEAAAAATTTVVDVSDAATVAVPPLAVAPVQMGNAQVLQLDQTMGSQVMQAVAAIQQAAPVQSGGAVLEGIRTLEGTLGRLEESLNFAVECMRTDLAQAKAQLNQLKAQVIA